MGVVSNFVMGREQTPIEYLLVTQLKLEPDKAKLCTAVFQLLVFAALVTATLLFVQWRFVDWEAKGCSAFCNCTMRLLNRTYVI